MAHLRQTDNTINAMLEINIPETDVYEILTIFYDLLTSNLYCILFVSSSSTSYVLIPWDKYYNKQASTTENM